MMQWEKEKYTKMSEMERVEYKQAILDRSSILKKEKDGLLVRSKNENKIWRYNNDISTLNWRLKYLNSVVESSPLNN